MQLETLNKLPSVFAMIGSADHFLSLCSALQLLTDLICSAELCLTLIYLIAHNECQTFLLSYFSPSFLISKSHLRHSYFLSVLQSVRGGRWALRETTNCNKYSNTENFFKTHIKKYKSTILTVNMPPGSPIVLDSTIIMLLDAKSFPTLFALTKVDKANVLTGAYMPSTDFTGRYRTTMYQDPSEDTHGKLKAFCFHVLNMARPKIFPKFARAFDELCVDVEKTLEKDGKASFSDKVDGLIFKFLCRALIGENPVAPSPASLGTSRPTHVKTWLVPQLSPIVSSGILPNVLDETTIHTIPLPFARVSQDSKKLYDFIYTHRSALLDFAVEEFGLPRDEACHDLLFNMGFNAFGGMLIFFPNIVKYVAKAGEDLHREIVKEFRGAVEGNEGLNMKVLESMPLVRSVVYEALRMDLHAALQYGRAKTDFMVESFDAAYEVKKGEFLGGYQPLATKDPSVFANAEDFVAGRFMGEEGEKLWQYVVWSNGPKTEMPMTDNNKCAGKDIVLMVARLLVAHLFLCDDSFALDESSLSAIFTQFTKAFQK